MEGMMTSLKTWRRLATATAVLLIVVAGGLVGGAGTSQAATAFDVALTPLIQQVTFGGKIGYHLHVKNSGDSTTQFVQIIVRSDTATYLDDDSDLCDAYPGDTHKMLCTPPGSTMSPGDTLDVNFRFTAPETGSQVSTNADVIVAAKSVGGSKNQGTILATCPLPGCPVLTTLSANGSKSDTFLRKHDHAATGNFSLDTPDTLLGDPFGIAVSIHDEVGAPFCATCSFTSLTIPAAPLVSTTGNPFYNGTLLNPFNPYSWGLSMHYPNGFQFTGIVHFENGATTPDLVPPCADLNLAAPTVDDPVCWDSLTQNKGAKTVTSSGRALENGLFGLG
jgi:hypothetical protein